ncbi:hypothetical protein O6H91_07G028900 [Diphasiastrum complanatum]|uniref:Uncharacterized protein n=1 Tax=Diphasiastrum complanatum TaxID=34168 RepID=A0ACC2D3L8_DIPCM|nr:hypothetical protein O6H91_07G028900 [Diphasiastrum complanatum]
MMKKLWIIHDLSFLTNVTLYGGSHYPHLISHFYCSCMGSSITLASMKFLLPCRSKCNCSHEKMALFNFLNIKSLIAKGHAAVYSHMLITLDWKCHKPVSPSS